MVHRWAHTDAERTGARAVQGRKCQNYYFLLEEGRTERRGACGSSLITHMHTYEHIRTCNATCQEEEDREEILTRRSDSEDFAWTRRGDECSESASEFKCVRMYSSYLFEYMRTLLSASCSTSLMCNDFSRFFCVKTFSISSQKALYVWR